MNLLHISNTFNLLVQQSAFFQSYHFGYHTDINTNVPNNFDTNGEVGKMYPHVAWVAPVEGNITMQGDAGRDAVDVMLFFYDLHDYRNDGEPVSMNVTLARQWNTLKARAVEFLHGLHKSQDFRIQDGKVKYFTDSNLQIDRLICVGVEFTLQTTYGCSDYESQNPPLSAKCLPVSKSEDLEARHV